MKTGASKRILRHEAEALSLKALSKSQTEAFVGLAETLRLALKSSAPVRQRNTSRLAFLSGKKGTGKSSLIHTLRKCYEEGEFYARQISLLGEDEKLKAQASLHAKLNKDEEGEEGEGAFSPTERQKIIWLPPLSLDPMPKGTNFLAAVLARIESTVSKIEGDNQRRRGALDPRGELGETRHLLNNLKAEAVKALEGNLDRHAPKMNIISYSSAANDAESTKVSLTKRLDSILDGMISGLAEGSDQSIDKEGIFVMVFDDLDLRPSKAVEVLKLAHTLTSRRLFYVYIGSLVDLDEVLYFDVQGEFNNLLHQSIGETERRKIEASANEISSSLIRKMIPLGQRFEVEDMEVKEALEYDPDPMSKNTSAEAVNLKTKLKSIPPFNNAFVDSDELYPEEIFAEKDKDEKALKQAELAVEKWKKLYEQKKTKKDKVFNFCRHREGEKSKRLFNVDKIFDPTGFFRFYDFLNDFESHSMSQEGEVIYDGARIICSTPRHIGDLLHSLDVVKMEAIVSFMSVDEITKENLSDFFKKPETKKLSQNASAIAKWLNKLFKGLLDEDGHLTVPVQNRLKNAVEEHHTWELTPPNMRIRAIEGDTISVTPHEWRNTAHMSPYDLTFKMSRIMHYDLEVQEAEDSDENIEDVHCIRLNNRSRPAFKILHDFFIFSGVGVVTRDIPCINEHQQGQTCWKTGGSKDLVVSWSSTPWRSFWRQDIFTDFINSTFETVRKVQRQRSKIEETGLSALLILSWITSTLEALDAQPSDLGMADADPKDQNEFDITTSKMLLKQGEDGKWLITADDQEYFTNLSTAVKKLYEVLVGRISDGQVDGYTEALKDKLIECLLLFMPEAGPMMFFMNTKDSYETQPAEQEFAKVFKIFVDELYALKIDDKTSVKYKLFEEITRTIRAKRVEKIGDFISTKIGLGFLMMEPDVFARSTFDLETKTLFGYFYVRQSNTGRSQWRVVDVISPLLDTLKAIVIAEDSQTVIEAATQKSKNALQTDNEFFSFPSSVDSAKAFFEKTRPSPKQLQAAFLKHNTAQLDDAPSNREAKEIFKFLFAKT